MPEQTGSLPPILCAPLLAKTDNHLLHLLNSLEPAEWSLATIVPRWKVRDIAAHLLDTALRKLSMVRDAHFTADAAAAASPPDVVALVNRLNHEGVTVYRRLSPPVLIRLMRIACEESARFHESLDPFAAAAFNVSWAGEDKSLNWFDTARELTERWHHQQQIRLAADRRGIMTPELYHPVLDCFMRGLPHAYRRLAAPVGTTLQFEISGDSGGLWELRRQPGTWSLVTPSPAPALSRVIIPQFIAWRVFTKGIDRASALPQIKVEGNPHLGLHILNMTAIVG